ncbi:MAG: HEAT repeat domain-containing protein, partial [Planctomycetota bacterium]
TDPTRSGGEAKKKKGGPAAASMDRWELWWEANKASYMIPMVEGFQGEPSKEILDETVITSLKKAEQNLALLLAKAYTDNDRNIRMVAAITMARVADGSFANYLGTGIYKDSDSAVRQTSMLALGILGRSKEVQGLLRIAANPKLEDMERGFAIFGVGFCGEEKHVASLIELFNQEKKNLEIQTSIVTAIGFIPSKTSAQFLAQLIEKESFEPEVRAFACKAISQMNDSWAIPSLLKAFKDRKPEVRQAAALALGYVDARNEDKFAKQRDLELINALKKEKDSLTLGFICITIGKLNIPNASFHLAQVLQKTKHPNLRGFAAIGLGLTVDEKARKTLRNALVTDKNWTNIGAYVIALGLNRDPEAIPAIAKLMAERKGDRDFTEIAVSAIGLVRDHDSKTKDILYNVLKENTRFSGVIRNAAFALSMSGDGKRATEYLKRLADHPNQLVSANAALTLGEINSAEVVPDLIKLYQESQLTSFARQYFLMGIGKAFENQRRKVSLLRRFSAGHNYRVRTMTYDHVLKIP